MPHVIENVVCTLASPGNRTGLRCDCQGQPICGSCSSTSTSTESISAVSEQSSADRSSAVESSAATSTECVERPCSPEWQTVIGSRTDRCWLFTVPGAVDELTCFCWKWESATQPDELVITDLDTGLVVYDSGCVGTQGLTPEVCYTKLGPQRYMVYVNADCAHTGGVTVFEFLWKCACSSAQPQPSSETASTPSQTQSSAYVSTPSQDIPSTGSQTQESNVIFVECSSSMPLNIKFKDCATHTMPVVLPPNQAGTAQVVKINGICYQRVGLTADPAQELLIEGVFTDCVTCAGSSAAGSPTSSAQGSSATSSGAPSTPIPPGPSSTQGSSDQGSSATVSSAQGSSSPALASCAMCSTCESSYDAIYTDPLTGYSGKVKLTSVDGCRTWTTNSMDHNVVAYDDNGLAYDLVVTVTRNPYNCKWTVDITRSTICDVIPGTPPVSFTDQFVLGTYDCFMPGTWIQLGKTLQIGPDLQVPQLNDICTPGCCNRYTLTMSWDDTLACGLQDPVIVLTRNPFLACTWTAAVTRAAFYGLRTFAVDVALERCLVGGEIKWILYYKAVNIDNPADICAYTFVAGYSACPPSTWSVTGAQAVLLCTGASSEASSGPTSSGQPSSTQPSVPGPSSVQPSSAPGSSTASVQPSSAQASSPARSSAPTSSAPLPGFDCTPTWQQVYSVDAETSFYINFSGPSCFHFRYNTFDKDSRVFIKDMSTGSVIFNSGCITTGGVTPSFDQFMVPGAQQYLVWFLPCYPEPVGAACSFEWRCNCDSSTAPSTSPTSSAGPSSTAPSSAGPSSTAPSSAGPSSTAPSSVGPSSATTSSNPGSPQCAAIGCPGKYAVPASAIFNDTKPCSDFANAAAMFNWFWATKVTSPCGIDSPDIPCGGIGDNFGNCSVILEGYNYSYFISGTICCGPAAPSSTAPSSTAPSSAQPSLSGDSTCAQMGQPGCTSTGLFTAFSDIRPEFFTSGVFTATPAAIAAHYMETSYPPDYPALCSTGSPCAYTVGPLTLGNANVSPPYGVDILLDVTICCGCC